MAAAGAAAGPPAPLVHPVTDGEYRKASKPIFESCKEEDFPAFIKCLETMCNNLGMLYSCTVDPITRGNQITALAIDPLQVSINQSRLYNMLVNAIAHYAMEETYNVQRGTTDAGSTLLLTLYNCHCPGNSQDHVSLKEDLIHFTEPQFKDNKFDECFREISALSTMVNSMSAANQQVYGKILNSDPHLC